MKNLIRFIGKYYLFILFIFLEITSFTLLINHNKFHYSVFSSVSVKLTGKLFSFVQHVKDYMYLVEVNAQLIEENNRIKNTLISAYKDNKVAYKDIYDSVFEKQWSYIQTKIVFNSTNKQNNILIIDKGSKHGIKPEMGLVTGKGVIGIIRDVSENYSSALSLLNTNVKISAKHKKTDYFGILQWDGIDNQICRFTDVPNHITLNNGDTVVTSGYSSIFPEGIPMGVISDFNKSEDVNSYDISVKLFQDFKSISYTEAVESVFKSEIDSLKIRN